MVEPLNLAALIILVSLLALAAALEIFGLFQFTTYLRSLLKRRPPTGSSCNLMPEAYLFIS